MQTVIILYNTFIILTLSRKVLCLNLTNVIFLSSIFGGLPNCGCFYTGTNGAPMNKLLNMFSSTKFWVPDRLPQICYCFLLLLANITRRDMKINRCSFRKADDLMRWRPSATPLPSSPRPIQHPEVLPVLSSEVLLHVTPIHPDLQHHS